MAEKDDKEARAARAAALRADIERRSSGKGPSGPLSPRELTDEAARKAWEEAKKGGKGGGKAD